MTIALCAACHHLRDNAVSPFCDAQRLPDPDGNLLAIPSRPNAPAEFFRFGASDAQRDASKVSRMISRGPATGTMWKWPRGTGWPQPDDVAERVPCEYRQRSCPAFTRRTSEMEKIA